MQCNATLYIPCKVSYSLEAAIRVYIGGAGGCGTLGAELNTNSFHPFHGSEVPGMGTLAQYSIIVGSVLYLYINTQCYI